MIIRRDGTRLLVAAILAILANAALLGVAALLVRDTPLNVIPSVRVPVNILSLDERPEEAPPVETPPEPPPEEISESFAPEIDLPSFNLDLPGPPALSIVIGDLNIQARDEDFIFQTGDLDQSPRVVARVPPVYPFRARQRGIEGAVRVRFLVAPDGSLSRISIVDADPAGVFEESVLQILPRWQVAPGRIDGEAVHSWMATTVRFELSQ